MNLTTKPLKNWSNELSEFYTYDAWFDKFQPKPNPLRTQDHGADYAFETYGDELDFVVNTDNNYVWTEVDGDSGTYIVAGFALVNRFQYYVTNKPYTDEWTEVPTWVYRECDNAVEGECPTDCPECNGEGTVNIPVDTVEDLEKIYGEDANIVA